MHSMVPVPTRFVRPKRVSELFAIIAISVTFFLYIRTRDSNAKLRELELTVTLQSEALGLCKHITRLAASAGPTKKEIEKFEFSHIPAADKINNTKKAKLDIIFFNRVPKVGSQMLIELARRLSIPRKFGWYLERVGVTANTRLTTDLQKETVKYIHNFKLPAFYSQHVSFLNFSQSGFPDPIYINMVRDPVERVISWYYYIRAAWYITERKRSFPTLELPTSRWLKKDFETCVRTNDPECRYVTGDKTTGIDSHLRQSMFFCGHEESCLPLNTELPVQRAKERVERDYAVVGVLEHLNATITVLEHYIPKYFTGATQVYRDFMSNSKHINGNNYKPPVSEQVKDILRKKLAKEMEFYQFCKQRLYLQLRALRLPNT